MAWQALFGVLESTDKHRCLGARTCGELNAFVWRIKNPQGRTANTDDLLADQLLPGFLK